MSELAPSLFHGCTRLERLSDWDDLRELGMYSLSETGLEHQDGWPQSMLLGVESFRGSALRSFRGAIAAAQGCPRSSPFDNCRELRVLDLRGGSTLGPEELAGLRLRSLTVDMPVEQAWEAFSPYHEGRIEGQGGSRGMGVTAVTIAYQEALRGKCMASLVDLQGLSCLPKGSRLDWSLAVREVALPVCVKAVPKRFFRGCRRLRKVNIEDCLSLEKVGFHAFIECWTLGRLYFGPGVISIKCQGMTGATRLDLSLCRCLVYAGIGNCPWLRSLRTPLHYRWYYLSVSAPRLQRLTCGRLDLDSVHLSGRPVMIRYRGMCGPPGYPMEGCLSELAAVGAVLSRPATP